jgi:hypothetical protein
MRKKTLLFHKKDIAEPCDSKAIHTFEFSVPDGTVYLEICFDYKPRACASIEKNTKGVEDAVDEYLGEELRKNEHVRKEKLASPIMEYCKKTIRNLINLSFYDPSGKFRGRWDPGFIRGKMPAYIIGTERSSPGMLSGEIPAGKWRAALELWYIFTNRCEYNLEINACFDREPQIKKKKKSSFSFNPLEIVPPAKGWARGEMHAHTRHSDGQYTVSELIEAAKKFSLDFIALTDHNTVSGFEEALKSDFPVLRGEEITTFYGHFCVYGIESTVDWHPEGKLADMDQIARSVRKNGGLFTISHPHSIGEPVCVGCRWNGKKPSIENVDLFDIWSSDWKTRFPETLRNIKLWDTLLEQGYRLTGVSGRDWHSRIEDDSHEIAFPRTMIKCSSVCEEELIRGLKNGEVYLTSGPVINIAVKDSLGGIGDSFSLKHGNIEINAGISGNLREKSHLVVKWNGKTVEMQDIHSNPCSILLSLKNPGRYRFEIWGKKTGELFLITNHIYVL